MATPPPHFINSVDELRRLSTSLSVFQRRYDDLQGHLEYIRTTIDSKLPEQSTTLSSTQAPSPIAPTSKPVSNEVSANPSAEKFAPSSKPVANEVSLIPSAEKLATVSSTKSKPKSVSNEVSANPSAEKFAPSSKPVANEVSLIPSAEKLATVSSTKSKPKSVSNEVSANPSAEKFAPSSKPVANEVSLIPSAEKLATISSTKSKPKSVSNEVSANPSAEKFAPSSKPVANKISLIPSAEKLATVSSTQAPSPIDPSPIAPTSKPVANEVSLIPSAEKLATVSSTESKPKPETDENSEEKPMEVELKELCEAMVGRDLRRYILTHLVNASKLREEVPKALKFAPNPAMLVLDAIGKFYVQGSSAFVKDERIGRVREASVLILECFLRIGVDSVEIEHGTKRRADSAAKIWMKRLKDEGGILKASVVDAQGLLFLISAFGIFSVFGHTTLRDLIIRSNPRAIYDALRCSSHLMSRITGVLEQMVKDKKHIGAVNLAYTFELESFQLPVLRAFLQEMEDVWKKAITSRPGWHRNKANTIWLNNMVSVVNCLKKNELNHSKLLPEWKLDEKISHMKKEIADINKEIKKKENEAKLKRKAADKIEPSKNSKIPKAPKVEHPQEIVSGGRAQVKHLGGGSHSQINHYSASPSVAGSLPAHTAAFHGDPYRLHQDIALNERSSLSSSFVGQSSIVGPNRMYRRASPPPPMDGFVGRLDRHRAFEGFAGLPDQHRTFEGFAGLPDQHRSYESFAGLPGRSFEGFAGLPDYKRGSGRSSASDLYQFADSVAEMESKLIGRTSPVHHKYNF